MGTGTDTSQRGVSITIVLPPELRAQAGHQRAHTLEGGTVRDIVDALEERYPGMRFSLCYETGELRPYVNIYVNGENVRYLQDLDTLLSEGAQLHVMRSVAGG